jgi:hypothetical protein
VPFDGSQTFQGFFSVHATHSTWRSLDSPS